MQVAHQLHVRGDDLALLRAEAGNLDVSGLRPRQRHGGVLDHRVVARMDLGVADGHVDIDALVLDLQRRLEREPRPLEDVLGFGGAGGGEHHFDLGAPDPAEADLGDVAGEAMAELVEDLGGQFRSQLPAQLAEAPEAGDGHEHLQITRLGADGGDVVQQRRIGGVAGGQGRRQPIGHCVERRRAPGAGPKGSGQTKLEVAVRKALQGVGEGKVLGADGRLDPAGACSAHAGSHPIRIGARRHGRMKALTY